MLLPMHSRNKVAKLTRTSTTNWLRRMMNSEPPGEIEEELREQHAAAMAWLYDEVIALTETGKSPERMWDALVWAALSYNHLENHLTDPERAKASISAALAEKMTGARSAQAAEDPVVVAGGWPPP